MSLLVIIMNSELTQLTCVPLMKTYAAVMALLRPLSLVFSSQVYDNFDLLTILN